MAIKRGVGVSPGVVIGRAVVLETEEARVPRRTIPAALLEHELHLVERSFESARAEVAAEREVFAGRAGDELADIFGFHERWLADPKPRKEISQLIRDKTFSAAYAIGVFMRRYRRRFLEMSSPYLQERAKDILDIERRLLRHVGAEVQQEVATVDEPVIVFAHDLTPSQTVTLERTRKLLGFATDLGGSTSHTAIVARGLGIPAVVGLGDMTSLVSAGDVVILDGSHGVVIVNPDSSQVEEYETQAAHLVEVRHALEGLRDLPAVTKDGERIALLGNIEFPEEVVGAVEKGAEGIGLFRTEFLFLQGGPEPSEEEQFQVYRQAAELLSGRPLVIRTVDLGADKYVQGKVAEPERNPFLGLRSIRYCLQNLAMFRAQLRAIMRASNHGNVRIMFPLITRVMELRQARYLLSLVMEELEEEGYEFRGNIPVGVMVETPAAALCARELAREVDFFSIGTNDLIQYTLAVDRTNEKVAQLYTALNPSVLRLIKMIIDAGDGEQRDMSMCGEMAADPMCTMLLIGMGLRKFSAVANSLPMIKRIVRSITLADAHRVASRVAGFETEREVVNYLRDETRKVAPDLV
ncbi:MAG: phosphoenolpyruvate--protein phosphotransferase [Phycisphaerae bacterium]|nr:phosphoenolpyruvate--protein phosphotransferase [Phycisphaerae bacterium]